MDTTSTAHEIVECRVCGKVDWQEVVSFGPVPLANGFLDPAESYEGESYYPLGVRSCRCCRLMSLTHVVDPEVLFRSYLYVTSDSETMTQHMHYVAKVCCERFGLDRDSFVVEIGSNTGAQLMAFRDAGIRTLGVDPARNIATVANESGIETLSEFFTVETAESIARMYGSAQLILGRHVFAHIDDVSGVMAGVRALLGPAASSRSRCLTHSTCSIRQRSIPFITNICLTLLCEALSRFSHGTACAYSILSACRSTAAQSWFSSVSTKVHGKHTPRSRVCLSSRSVPA